MSSCKKSGSCCLPKVAIASAAALAAVGAFYLISKKTCGASSAKTSSSAVAGENQALIFIKPHGQADSMAPFIEKELAAAGLRIVQSGQLPGVHIDQSGSIDAHYSAIGTYAMKMSPKDLPIAADKKAEFEKKYGKNFDALAKEGTILNIAGTQAKFGWSVEKLGEEFEKAKTANGTFKLAPGCYVVWMEEQKIFLVNGFYAAMRAEYVAPTAVVSWYVVSWPEAKLAWADFRGKVLGATDPTTAESSSVRAKVLANCKAMGLSFVPNTGKNCVHGSASPLEAFNERRIWVGAQTRSDSFGAALLAAGITTQQVDWMCSNPTVDGKPLFDIVEDTNTSDCLKTLVEVAKKAK